MNILAQSSRNGDSHTVKFSAVRKETNNRVVKWYAQLALTQSSQVRSLPRLPYIKAKVIFTEEIWKNYIHTYDVSNLGRLRNHKTGRILKVRPISKSNGRLGTVVTLGSKKKSKMIVVHRAVAEMFIPNPENKPEVNHKDGNKTNNMVDNLEWVNGKENKDHAIRTGLVDNNGERNGQAKLTVDDVLYIKNNIIPNSRDFGCGAMARRFGVSKTLIIGILQGKYWKNIV